MKKSIYNVQGFTLVEVIVVITIFCILIASGIYTFGGALISVKSRMSVKQVQAQFETIRDEMRAGKNSGFCKGYSFQNDEMVAVSTTFVGGVCEIANIQTSDVFQVDGAFTKASSGETDYENIIILFYPPFAKVSFFQSSELEITELSLGFKTSEKEYSLFLESNGNIRLE